MKSAFNALMALFTLALLTSPGAAEETEVDFGRDIRPILSGKCFHCHGPDPESREAGLRLDLENKAKSELDSGLTAIAPGNLQESELFARIISDDEFTRMPPPEIGKELSEHEVELFRKWIEQGAQYAPHWSFIPPQKHTPPTVKNSDWVKNEIDAFILKRLEEEGLTPNSEADKYALARRGSFALTGLPLSVEQTEAFVQDESPQAYEKLVDQLLADPAYGERWARVWLDIARYADSMGYEKDSPRTIWPYRDWVIRAINENKPFDQFSIEQPC